MNALSLVVTLSGCAMLWWSGWGAGRLYERRRAAR